MPETQDTISKAHLAAAQAVDSLRRQLGIILQEDNGSLLAACPVEGLTPGLLERLRAPQNQGFLILTGARARSLGLDAKDAKAVCIDAREMTLADMTALADPIIDKAAPKMELLPATPAHDMLMMLAKYSSLLPAMLVVKSNALPLGWPLVSMRDVADYWNTPPLDILPLAKAALPVDGAEDATLICFRERYGTSSHLALVIGNIAHEKNPLARVHSSCITGDILGSLRCDCGDQLRLALDAIKKQGAGILVYLHQEGRGIGIANKLRAYQLQEQGADTYEANLMLGFDEDERDFAIAAAILKNLDADNIRLLTNNPRKAEQLQKYGIAVAGCVKLAVPEGKHNHAYLSAKAKKMGK